MGSFDLARHALAKEGYVAGHRTTVSYEKRNQKIVHEYMDEHGTSAVDAEKAAEWAIETGRWARKPPTALQLCKRDLSRAMRSEYMTDPQGRAVRRMHPARYPRKGDDGAQSSWLTIWADLFKAPPEHMRVSLQQRRRGILADARQHKIDAESYNDNNVHGTKLQLFDYNLNPDLEEMELPTTYGDEKPEEDES